MTTKLPSTVTFCAGDQSIHCKKYNSPILAHDMAPDTMFYAIFGSSAHVFSTLGLRKIEAQSIEDVCWERSKGLPMIKVCLQPNIDLTAEQVMAYFELTGTDNRGYKFQYNTQRWCAGVGAYRLKGESGGYDWVAVYNGSIHKMSDREQLIELRRLEREQAYKAKQQALELKRQTKNVKRKSQVCEARTKQTARMSTGGRQPRRPLVQAIRSRHESREGSLDSNTPADGTGGVDSTTFVNSVVNGTTTVNDTTELLRLQKDLDGSEDESGAGDNLDFDEYHRSGTGLQLEHAVEAVESDEERTGMSQSIKRHKTVPDAIDKSDLP